MSQFDFRNYLIFKGIISHFGEFFEKRWLVNRKKNERIASFLLEKGNYRVLFYVRQLVAAAIAKTLIF